MFDTIAAIATGYINQPISIIRVSGPQSFKIVKSLFTGHLGQHQTVTYGYIQDQGQKIDEVLISWFRGPRTFTGEDIVEINAHGGIVNSTQILELILKQGARIAERGEFSRRAFLNGKIDLVKAEAIHDLIFAKTRAQTAISVKKFSGQTSQLIESLKAELLNLIATCEINIDYPEYDDIEVLKTKTLLPKLTKLQKKLQDIKDISLQSQPIFQGLNVALVGRPNVGKSSLLNLLLNEDKAIVTSRPGTTRDIVEGQVQIGQVMLNLRDTAGIHKTSDLVEQIGIKRSLAEIKTADLVIHILDGKKSWTSDDLEIEQASSSKTYLQVVNKIDLGLRNEYQSLIKISVKNKKIESLINKLQETYQKINLNDEKIIANERQFLLIVKALFSIKEAISGLEQDLTPDTIIIDLRQAWEHLANILGQASQSDLLDSMFKNFCLGK